ncbi:aldehyde ferredoxin oxidoreductase C-terminal domain-containing protein [Hydrogenophilus thermoluteolus]|uniref:aldehyde ferredoxin oxidoreductase C-terminal domain-containing protein n=1 Tax=Hydrogenophilus thermoluteolus TaxID=297 RepID=UPI003F679743
MNAPQPLQLHQPSSWLPAHSLTVALDDGSVTRTEHHSDAITGPIEYGWRAYQQHGRNAFTFGIGRLADSPLAGARRLFVCGYSHQWESFYLSSAGGVAYTFKHFGIPWVTLVGRAAQPSVLILRHDGNAATVTLEPIPDLESLWRDGYRRASDGAQLTGALAVQQAMLDRFGVAFPPKQVRALAVGPAAAVTWEGTIVSNPVEKGAITWVTEFCGRGGMGSTLFRDFNIAALLVGGAWEPAKESTKAYDPDFEARFGDRYVKVEQRTTVKYSFDPKTGTGGTFGSNYAAMGDKILSFHYQSVFAPKPERLAQMERFVRGHYWKQFQEETIANKQFEHCGEPCSVACKKMNGPHKKDYEPYHTLGPQIGIFDQRAAERVNDVADAMGFDAIQLGGTLGWLFEAITAGDFDPTELGLPRHTNCAFAASPPTRRSSTSSPTAPRTPTTPCARSTRSSGMSAPPRCAKGSALQRRPSTPATRTRGRATARFTSRTANAARSSPTNISFQGCSARCRSWANTTSSTATISFRRKRSGNGTSRG